MSGDTFQKPDGNKAAIVKRLESRGGVWVQTMRREAGYDCIAHGLFPLAFIFEIKAQTGTLTDNEKRVKSKVESVKGLYPVLRFESQADTVLDIADKANEYGWSMNRIYAEILRLDLE